MRAGAGRRPPGLGSPVGILVPTAALGPLPAGMRLEVERPELVHTEDGLRLVRLGYDLAIGDRVQVLAPVLLSWCSRGRGRSSRSSRVWITFRTWSALENVASALFTTGMLCADSSIRARRQATTDPVPPRMIRGPSALVVVDLPDLHAFSHVITLAVRCRPAQQLNGTSGRGKRCLMWH